MDDIELATLARELEQDCAVALAAFTVAKERLQEATPSGYEGCAHHLARLYNVVELMGIRVAKVFENSLDDEKGWHSELLRRLSLEIADVRPALWDQAILQPLHELRGFRHVFTHAYDLTLDPDKLRLLLKYAGQVMEGLRPGACDFIQRVAAMHSLTPPKC